MRQLGITALRATHVMNRLKGLMRSALALAALGMFLDRKHDNSKFSKDLREGISAKPNEKNGGIDPPRDS
jgi:hypothetical protein